MTRKDLETKSIEKLNSIDEAIELINLLDYDECLMLIDKSNDIPTKIYDEILKRARYLWRSRE